MPTQDEFEDIFDDNFIDRVLDNAFDFLDRALSEFKTSPKYSVIHFNSAVELILKARLMHEHWSLIVLKKPDKQKFKTGNFRSISLQESIEKIELVLNETVPSAAQEAFSKIADHRNKMVHFYHEAVAGEASEKIITEVAIEQLNGWYHLRNLIDKWKGIFPDQQGRIYSVNHRMSQHKEYLRFVYDQIKKEIAAEKADGAEYSTCSSCSYEAAKNSELTDILTECSCKVCFFKDRFLSIQCPECDNDVRINPDREGAGQCATCEHEISSEETFELVNDESLTNDEILCGDAKTPANCGWCSCHGSVLEHNEEYLCINCMETGDVGFCGWCNEPQLGGNLEYSHYGGCEFCDGLAGWKKDE